MKNRPEVKEGMKIKDNDPRNSYRKGEVMEVNPAAHCNYAKVEWNTGKTTYVRLDRIGIRSKTGYSIVEQP